MGRVKLVGVIGVQRVSDFLLVVRRYGCKAGNGAGYEGCTRVDVVGVILCSPRMWEVVAYI